MLGAHYKSLLFIGRFSAYALKNDQPKQPKYHAAAG
jgi:hypothetical protein